MPKSTNIAANELEEITCTGSLNLVAPTRKDEEYEIVTCPNTFKFHESFAGYSNTKNPSGIHDVARNDDDVSLSIEDCRFKEIMDEGIQENQLGNWEMPLPIRSVNVSMPNNRNYALERLHRLPRTFKRKPEMQKDYTEFMSKMLYKGHEMNPWTNMVPTSHQRVPSNIAVDISVDSPWTVGR